METIAIYNKKGGVGKSSITVNLAVSLSLTQKKKVLVIDTDSQGNSSGDLMADFPQDKIQYTLMDAIENKVELKKCIYTVPFRNERANLFTSVDVVPIDDRIDTNTKQTDSLKKILQQVQSEYDICLIDCPPQTLDGTVISMAAANYVLVPIEQEKSSFVGWNKMLGFLQEIKQLNINPTLEIIGIVVNKIQPHTSFSKYVTAEMEESFGNLVFKTGIKQTITVKEAQWQGIPLCMRKKSAIGEDYNKLAKELILKLKVKKGKVGV